MRVDLAGWSAGGLDAQGGALHAQGEKLCGGVVSLSYLGLRLMQGLPRMALLVAPFSRGSQPMDMPMP